ncbi:MAG: SLC13 family permease, partial [Bacteroidota bacterium]
NLRGLFLTEIFRREQKITPVSPKEIIQQDDILIFAGATETIIDLLKSSKEFIIPKHSSMFNYDGAEIVEIVVSAESPLIGKTVKETNFRGKYDAAVVAVNRNGERLSGKIGGMKLQGGDLLLIVTGKDFLARSEESHDFYIISKLREIRNFQKSKVWMLIIGIVAAFLLPAFGVLTLFKTLLLLLCMIVLMKIVKLGEIKKGLDIELFVILALSLALGKAITKSGADQLFAGSIINLFHPLNSNVAVLLGVYLVTNILAMLVTNKAAVAITFPIAVAAAAKLGIDPKPFILAVAFAGCAEFMTPYGYQTNLMVYGPGGYKFRDYIRVGWGLSLLFMITCVAILGYMYNLY